MAGYPALRLVDLSGLADFFFSAPRLPSIGRSISFWPTEAFRAFLPLGAAVSLARLFFSASMRSTTFSPRGRGLAASVLPLRNREGVVSDLAIGDQVIRADVPFNIQHVRPLRVEAV